jgi:membrane-anchored protein YejM (alkaline phosphatase superfamily)
MKGNIMNKKAKNHLYLVADLELTDKQKKQNRKESQKRFVRICVISATVTFIVSQAISAVRDANSYKDEDAMEED